MAFLRIAHRGNVHKATPERENTLEYIQEALDAGFDAEIDLWISVDGEFLLGHDAGEHSVNAEWIMDRQTHLWVHCKNLSALLWAVGARVAHAFFHNTDDFTLTTCGRIWTYPGKPVTSESILVLFLGQCPPTEPVFGVCADNVSEL